MNFERAKVSAEIAGIKLRSRLLLTVQLVGIAAVLLGAFNFLVAGEGSALLPAYRTVVEKPAFADVGLMGAGAALAWFV